MVINILLSNSSDPPEGWYNTNQPHLQGFSCILPQILENILFLHAFTGYDAVSATNGHGKLSFLKTFEKNPDLAFHAAQFKREGQTYDSIVANGVQLLLALYNATLEYHQPKNEPLK